jgi:hypothetical protein
MTEGRLRFKSNCDAAIRIFRRISRKLADDEGEWHSEGSRQLDLCALDRYGVTASSGQKHTRKILAEALKIFLELNSFLMIGKV